VANEKLDKDSDESERTWMMMMKNRERTRNAIKMNLKIE
jgi:hypothetical protein